MLNDLAQSRDYRPTEIPDESRSARMNRFHPRLAALPLFLALCAGAPATDTVIDASMSPAADLAAAEAAVEAARQRQALWTTAVTALREARTAMALGDHAAVVTWSRRARELTELGLRQRQDADSSADRH
jgi:hypothetical protein